MTHVKSRLRRRMMPVALTTALVFGGSAMAMDSASAHHNKQKAKAKTHSKRKIKQKNKQKNKNATTQTAGSATANGGNGGLVQCIVLPKAYVGSCGSANGGSGGYAFGGTNINVTEQVNLATNQADNAQAEGDTAVANTGSN